MSARIRLTSPDTATRLPFRAMCALGLAFITQLTIGAAPARAHPGGHGPSASPLHQWVEPTTGRAVSASVLFVEAGRVTVETEEGSIVAWPIERLRAADRRHVGEHVLRTTFLNVRVTPPLQMAPRTEWPPFLPLTVMVAFAAVVIFYRGGVRGAAPLAWRSATIALLITVPLACGSSSPGSPSTPTSPSLTTPSPTTPSPVPTPTPGPSNASVLAAYFAPFSSVRTRSDSQYLYVESDGLANHTMMVGIRSWQQQVPLPMAYTGSNAFSIPLEARFADNPVSLRTALFTGAVALAINGVPIFNALNNRGDDTFLAGELDDFGGHAGRADDYHYHIAPSQLSSAAGAGKPIAVGLDGFALYPSGSEPAGFAGGALDANSGHGDSAATYHYHGSTGYPYIMASMRGAVQIANDQITPQPTTPAIRPAGSPLNGATVTAFRSTGTNAWSLEYRLNGGTYRVDYRVDGSRYTFVFVDPSGATRTETYPPTAPPPTAAFSLTSVAGVTSGALDNRHTCDGAGLSPPVVWTGTPSNAVGFALVMSTVPITGGTKYNWLLYNIPASATRLDENSRTVGTFGSADDGAGLSYAAPCAQGGGTKSYTFTLYALSGTPNVSGLSQSQVTGSVLVNALAPVTIGSSAITLTHTR